MNLWLLVGALLLILACAAWFVPASIQGNVQARAEPSGTWALAVGLALGPFAWSTVAAAGVAPFVTCHVWGRQLLRVPLSRGPRRQQPIAPLGRNAFARSFRGLDILETLLDFWWRKKRVLAVSSVTLDVEYSFRDVALTGQTLAALCVLSGVLPERYVIHQRPTWDFEDRVALTADTRFRVWPLRLLFDVLEFVLKVRSRARRQTSGPQHSRGP